MGYYTRYTLGTGEDGAGETPPGFAAAFEERSGYASDSAIGRNAYEVKWYGHEEDMRELSLRFPDVLFRLDGEGEEAGDKWIKFFRNGRLQTITVEMPKYEVAV